MNNNDKATVRNYVRNYYHNRNGRDITINKKGEVNLRIDGNGSQMINGRDVSGGRIFAGFAAELLAQAKVERQLARDRGRN